MIQDVIKDKIKPNGKGDITGQVLQDVLLEMANTNSLVLDVSSVPSNSFITLPENTDYNIGISYPFVQTDVVVYSRYDYPDYGGKLPEVENQIAALDPQIVRDTQETIFYVQNIYHVTELGSIAFFYAIYRVNLDNGESRYRIINIDTFGD